MPLSNYFDRHNTYAVVYLYGIFIQQKWGKEIAPPAPVIIHFQTSKMNKQPFEGNEKQSPEHNPNGKQPNRLLYAIKGLLRGVSTIIRPRQSFFFWRKRTKSDGSSTEMIISYDIG